MSLELARLYPNLNFIIQDRPKTVTQARELWHKELPGVLQSGKVELMEHDFFIEQPIKGAEVYLMRYIL
jgi:hypothetical protein